MRRTAFIIGIALILLSMNLLVGCSPPVIITKVTGPVVTRDYSFTDFNSIEVGNAFEVEIVPASSYNITVTANQSLFDYVEVSKSGGTLKIGMKAVNINFGTPKMKAKVSLPELWGLNLSGATRGTAKGFKSTHKFDLGVSGASYVDTEIETGNLEMVISGASKVEGNIKATGSEIVLSGASRIELSGSGGNARLNVSGASHAELDNFSLNDADINLSGASGAKVNVTGKMDVELSGASTLEYAGNPRIGNLNITGASQLKRR